MDAEPDVRAASFLVLESYSRKHPDSFPYDVVVVGRKEGVKGGGEVGRIGRYRLVHGGACQEKDDGTGCVWCVCPYFVAAGGSR